MKLLQPTVKTKYVPFVVVMRPLTDEELRIMFEKLQVFIGQNIAKLIDRSDDPHTFRLIKDRVFYISEQQMKLATNIGRENLLALGTCFGKFTKVRFSVSHTKS